MQNGSVDQVWDILNQVPDPEIPVISIVELGVVRDVKFINDCCIISITPTYSGCPAIKTFEDDIKTSLIKNKITNFKINKVYAPAWTTDWMSKETKEKLKEGAYQSLKLRCSYKKKLETKTRRMTNKHIEAGAIRIEKNEVSTSQ